MTISHIANLSRLPNVAGPTRPGTVAPSGGQAPADLVQIGGATAVSGDVKLADSAGWETSPHGDHTSGTFPEPASPQGTSSSAQAQNNSAPGTITVLEDPFTSHGAPGVDISSTRPSSYYQLLSGTSMALPGGGYLDFVSGSVSPDERARMVIGAAKSEGVSIEEAATFRVKFVGDETKAENFTTETRAAISKQAAAEGLPVAWESWDKIDKTIMGLSSSPYTSVLLHGYPEDQVSEFKADVAAWIDDRNSRTPGKEA